jgi:hypothetical protein
MRTTQLLALATALLLTTTATATVPDTLHYKGYLT